MALVSAPADVDSTLFRIRKPDVIQGVLDHFPVANNPFCVPLGRGIPFPMNAEFVIARQPVHNIRKITARCRARQRSISYVPVFFRRCPAAQAFPIEKVAPPDRDFVAPQGNGIGSKRDSY